MDVVDRSVFDFVRVCGCVAVCLCVHVRACLYL